MSEYERGKNPRSLQNLTRAGAGRVAKYGERKKREVLVSQEGWDGAQQACKDIGFSVSEMLEKLGRQELRLVIEESPTEPTE